MMLLGAMVFAAGAILDPFSIPFQDFEKLTTSVQQHYIDRSNSMKVIQIIGIILIVVPAIKLLVSKFANKQ